jgi:hypothetical protein
MYFHANFDAHGARLSGQNAYRWRVPPGGVPAKAFWSLTMYDAQPDGRYYLVENRSGAIRSATAPISCANRTAAR